MRNIEIQIFSEGQGHFSVSFIYTFIQVRACYWVGGFTLTGAITVGVQAMLVTIQI